MAGSPTDASAGALAIPPPRVNLFTKPSAGGPTPTAGATKPRGVFDAAPAAQARHAPPRDAPAPPAPPPASPTAGRGSEHSTCVAGGSGPGACRASPVAAANACGARRPARVHVTQENEMAPDPRNHQT